MSGQTNSFKPKLPVRTALTDAAGNLARTWILYFQSRDNAAASATAGVSTIDNVANTFTPDLSQGPLQYVLLVADSVLNQPVNEPGGFSWTLIIDQDATGGHNLTLDPTYFFEANILGRALKSTRAQSQWLSDANANNSLSGLPSTDQPIPTP